MRIVHLAKHCENSNGNVHVAVDLACSQTAAGHSVVFASAGGYYERMLASSGVTIEPLDQGLRNPFAVMRSVWRLTVLCRRLQPDVLHAHMMSSAVIGYLASKLTGVPLVTTVHNSFDAHSILMRLGDKVVAVSGAERELLLSRGFAPDRVVTVLNGPNASAREFWSPDHDEQTVTAPSPAIVTVCGLHPRKGVHDLLQAFSQVYSGFPQWHLNIIGEGPDQDRLKQMASTLGIAARTHFLGPVRAPQNLLRQSDIFVLASLAEPFGLVTAEARAAGCAIIATNVGGSPEVVGFGQAGSLVPPGQPEAIARELRRLMADPAELKAWRARSLQGSEFFDVARMAGEYESVYRTLQPG